MINRLPEDILSHIFIEGANADRCERQRSHKQPTQTHNQELRDVITWVCRDWKTLALRTTLLWAYIDLSDGPSYSRSARFLARSGDTQPLDIHLHIDRHFMRGLRKNDYDGHTERLVDALSFIINHGGDTIRWRTFSAKTTAAIVLDDIIDCLSEEPFPILESFDLVDCYRSPVDYSSFDGGIERTEPHLSLFTSQPPKLRSVKLRCFDSRLLLARSNRPVVSNLVFIELGLVDSEPPLDGIRLLLAHNLRIHTLRLNLTRVKPSFTELYAGQSLEPLSLISLKELWLTNPHSPLWTERFLLIFNAPSLCRLRLYLHYCFDSFYGMLKILIYGQPNSTASNSPHSTSEKKFPLLKYLSTNISDAWLEEFLRAYPDVDQLSLLPRHGPGAILLLSRRPWLLPKLRQLKISNCTPDARDILQTAQARANAEIPLQLIEIGRMQFSSLLFEDKMRELEQITGRTSLYRPDSDEGSGSDGYDGYEWTVQRPKKKLWKSTYKPVPSSLYVANE
ncbi:hypothetical protein FRC12_013093 [Ceratobasidium sp. 428]|nr:hypothetical protein FRC12_013093 [Ceratobasidium sp. 428]